ncbi:uncharacterized protein LOC141878510 [Acropora palmata]|uniref:uncharacterized protein LOC141878510 n=1 Tax=Acropora palmata TaxID=6131 RepID=UPI003DA04009
MAWLFRSFSTTACLTSFVVLICANGYDSSTLPQRPTDLQVTKVRNLDVTLTWKRPSNIPRATILLYRVRCATIGRSKSWGLDPLLEESATVQLEPNTQYNIHVKAMRKDDNKIQSAWQSLRVNTSHFVPARPTNLRQVRMTGLYVTVAWNKPLTTTTGIRDTSLLKYRVSSKRIDSVRKQISFTSTSATLRLVGNSTYQIQVQAVKSFNMNVFGPWSEILTLKSNPSAPTKPPKDVQLVSNTRTSISVSWGEIPENARNADILGFNVRCCKQADINCSPRKVALVYSLDITGLDPGKAYKVQVSGYNIKGSGPWSSSKQIIVGGRFLTTTQETTTAKLSTETLTSKTKKTSKVSTMSTRAPTTGTTPKPTATDDPLNSKGVVNNQNTQGGTSDGEKTHSVSQSTLPAALASQDERKPDLGSRRNVVIIGVAAGVLLLLILSIAVIVIYRRRSRRKDRHNGGILLHADNSRDTITHGTFSVRYTRPGDCSMTQSLLNGSVPPHRSLPRRPNSDAKDDSLLLGANCPEKCKLSVDLSPPGRSTFGGDRAEGLYDKLGDVASKNPRSSGSGERYVTRDQMGARSAKAPSAVTKAENCNGSVPSESTQQGDIYEKMQDSVHLYDTLCFKDRKDPVYENTKIDPNPPEHDESNSDGYEAMKKYNELQNE